MYKICLVEDEKDLNNLITTYLERENYQVVSFYNGEDAIDYVGTEEVNLWILDIMLGDSISGYDIIKKIREVESNVPVIFTSARDQELDKIIGLKLGSDDYITKPYSPRELMLRVKNILKRVYNKPIDTTTINGYTIELEKRTVFEQDTEIVLTSLEYDLLLCFLKGKGRSFSRDDLLKMVWGDDYFGNDRVVDDLIRRLRHKMPNIKIITMYGYGYKLI